jgi:DNA (cytosine-5)-methyltransferase 1
VNDQNHKKKTLGSICAGIGGFDLGFEQAGWETSWTIELDDVNRTVLADRFARARHFKDLRHWRSHSLSWVDCIAFGFPCQDISVMGAAKHDKSRNGLKGERSGLFHEIMEIVGHLQPSWVVIENVPALLHSNNCRDIATVIQELAQRNYLGFARVLNAQYFGVPQNRRRLFLVAGLGRYPSMDFLADSGPMEALPASLGSERIAVQADSWAGYTLTAPDKHNQCNSRINMGSELFVAEEDGWHSMVERARAVSLSGVSKGLDETHVEEAYAAGNAVPPPLQNGLLSF